MPQYNCSYARPDGSCTIVNICRLFVAYIFFYDTSPSLHEHLLPPSVQAAHHSNSSLLTVLSALHHSLSHFSLTSFLAQLFIQKFCSLLIVRLFLNVGFLTTLVMATAAGFFFPLVISSSSESSNASSNSSSLKQCNHSLLTDFFLCFLFPALFRFVLLF